ncbi:hypothetical protein SESBI_25545 [Sesbania bispinosa]|nr:hypothetical protein SESBI_25545 [Sesbania bispinosa]
MQRVGEEHHEGGSNNHQAERRTTMEEEEAWWEEEGARGITPRWRDRGKRKCRGCEREQITRERKMEKKGCVQGF